MIPIVLHVCLEDGAATDGVERKQIEDLLLRIGECETFSRIAGGAPATPEGWFIGSYEMFVRILREGALSSAKLRISVFPIGVSPMLSGKEEQASDMLDPATYVVARAPDVMPPAT